MSFNRVPPGMGFDDLPPAPPRKGQQDKEQDLKRLSMKAGTSPATGAADDVARIDLYERLRAFYEHYDMSRVQRGFGEIVDWALINGEERLNAKLRAKYNDDLDSFTKRQEAIARQEEEAAEQAAADLKKQGIERKESKGTRTVREAIIAFYQVHDPSRLAKGIDHLLAYVEQRGLDALNEKLIAKYGVGLDLDGSNPQPVGAVSKKPSRTPGRSPQQTPQPPARPDAPVQPLPENTYVMLQRYYVKWDPMKLTNGGIDAIYKWAARNGLAALDGQLKMKYQESLTEFIASVEILRDELMNFYFIHDKNKLASGIDQIVDWGLRNGRVALNNQLRQKYGADLDNVRASVQEEDEEEEPNF